MEDNLALTIAIESHISKGLRFVDKLQVKSQLQYNKPLIIARAGTIPHQ